MRRAPMRGQHAEQGALPVVERRGLHAAISGGGGGLAVRRVELVSLYVFYHRARSAAKGSAAGSIVIRVDNAEGFGERLVESVQRRKSENLPPGVIKLNVAEVSPHQADGRLENFFQRGLKVRRGLQARAAVVEVAHGLHLDSESGFRLAQRFFGAFALGDVADVGLDDRTTIFLVEVGDHFNLKALARFGLKRQVFVADE